MADAKKKSAKGGAGKGKKAAPGGPTLAWMDGKVRLVDPAKRSTVAAEYGSVDELAAAVDAMSPEDEESIRVAGVLGVVLAANSVGTLNEDRFYRQFSANVRRLVGSRGGQDVNLLWGVNRMMAVAAKKRNRGIAVVKEALIKDIPAAIAHSEKVVTVVVPDEAEAETTGAKATPAKTAAKKAPAKKAATRKRKTPQIPATIEWADGTIRLIDQSKLPLVGEIVECKTPDELIFAIQSMKVRGAPALGVAGAMGVALIATTIETMNENEYYRQLTEQVRRLIVARPTAANLIWGVNRMMALATAVKNRGISAVKKAMIDEIPKIVEEDISRNRAMARYGAKLVKDGDSILTHCNAGALATAGFGTALGVIFAAFADGKDIKVYVDETRPCLQGARLSTWELMMAEIPTVLIVDSAAGLLMREGEITKVFVGADRIAANGDVANKIGTYPLSVVAKENKVPFYVVAPTSTIDMFTPHGRKVPIELRGAEELTMVGETQIAPDGVQVYNPAFDVTPAKNVTAIITEKGVIKPPYGKAIAKLMAEK